MTTTVMIHHSQMIKFARPATKHAFWAVAVGFLLASCDLVNEPATTSESPTATSQSDATISAQVGLSKGHKCKPWPECRDGGGDGEVVLRVDAILGDSGAQAATDNVVSNCSGSVNNKPKGLKGDWQDFCADLTSSFYVTSSGGKLFDRKGHINIDSKDESFMFWLWDDKGDVWVSPGTGKNSRPPKGNLEVDFPPGGFTFHAHQSVEMSPVQGSGSVGTVYLGDFVFTPVD